MRAAAGLQPPQYLDNPACVLGPNQRCAHSLVDQELNHQLFDYECQIRNRFAPITDVLMAVSTMQHETAFVARAQQISQTRLGYRLPEKLLQDAWVVGLDMRALH